METRLTKKEVRKHYNIIVAIGYCNAQYLLSFRNPFAYSTRVEGWACDYYDIDGTCVSTGYAPIGEKIDYCTLQKYETKAREIVNSCASFEDKQREVDFLLKELLHKLNA